MKQAMIMREPVKATLTCFNVDEKMRILLFFLVSAFSSENNLLCYEDGRFLFSE